MAEQSRRFASLDKPIDKFIEDHKNKNTLSKTRRDVSLLTEFLNSKSEIRRIEEIPPKELNEYVSEFIVAVRRKDGEDFEPSSLRGLICSFTLKARPANILAVLLKTASLNKRDKLWKLEVKNSKKTAKETSQKQQKLLPTKK